MLKLWCIDRSLTLKSDCLNFEIFVLRYGNKFPTKIATSSSGDALGRVVAPKGLYGQFERAVVLFGEEFTVLENFAGEVKPDHDNKKNKK